MVDAISRSTPGMPGAPSPRRSPSMDAELSTARAKLQDWVSCPSAKTPEGKAEVRKATDKLETVKSEIRKADDASQRVAAAQPTDARASGRSGNGDAAPDDLGDGLAALARRNLSAAAIFGASAVLGGNLNIQA